VEYTGCADISAAAAVWGHAGYPTLQLFCGDFLDKFLDFLGITWYLALTLAGAVQESGVVLHQHGADHQGLKGNLAVRLAF
jgi:hypothetical protein